MEENKFNGSANAGSPEVTSVPNPNSFGGAVGETQNQAPQIDPVQHKELESLVGRQGAELGEYRKFISDISPLLDKLDKSPELIQAIVDGKITPDLAKAAMEGKVSITDAEIVNTAAAEVKKDLTKAEYKGASPEEISKLIEDKARELKGDLQKELKERDDLSAFESSVNDFINRTPDFSKYSKEIDAWLDEHDVTDISIAYYAVKGELSEKEARAQAEIDKAELEKSGALNMGGGSGNSTHRISADSNMIDSLISNKANPNSF